MRKTIESIVSREYPMKNKTLQDSMSNGYITGNLPLDFLPELLETIISNDFNLKEEVLNKLSQLIRKRLS